MRGQVVGMGRSVLAWIAAALLGVASSTVAPAAPRDVDRPPGPSPVSPLPTHVHPVEPAVAVSGSVGGSDEGDRVATVSRVESVRSFAAAWEYMLDRAFIVTPHNAAFGGAALVDTAGRVIGVTSLRLGEAPHVNLAIPIEQFVAVKDELIARGRVTSRAPRPWLGLYTEPGAGGVLISGLSPLSPGRAAGLRPGDVIVQVNGRQIASPECFYPALWHTRG